MHPRESARLSGDKHYSTGRACKNGHLCQRETVTGSCLECKKACRSRFRKRLYPERSEEWRERIRENHRRFMARKKAEDPEWAKRRNKKAWQRRKANRYALATRPMPDACEVCGEHGKVVFDHCHATGKFRGWICDDCNKSLGILRDSPERLRKLADYLESANNDMSTGA